MISEWDVQQAQTGDQMSTYFCPCCVTIGKGAGHLFSLFCQMSDLPEHPFQNVDDSFSIHVSMNNPIRNLISK